MRSLSDDSVRARDVLGEVREGGLNPYSAARRIIEDRAAVAELLSNPAERERLR
jgi:hypothetical protein